jgi:LL-diaminopimelate aminotransferase
MTIQPADRLSLVQEYYFSRKLKEVAKLNAEGQDIISLAIGSPDMPPSKQTIDKLCEVASKPEAHGYQPTMGTPELREAMAGFYKRWYGVDVDPKTEVQPLIGSKEGILHVTLAFVNPDEQVLVPNPGYPTYTSLSKILGAEIVNYNLCEDNGWQPDFDELEKMDLSRVRLMWTNYPNMPTGGNARRETYERLVAFAKKHNIVVVNDNPYSFILNDNPMSLLQVPGAKDCCIEFNSMSKSHNMPGWRVGMCVSNPTFISWILKIKSNIDSGTFRGIQLAAAEAYNTLKAVSKSLHGERVGRCARSYPQYVDAILQSQFHVFRSCHLSSCEHARLFLHLLHPRQSHLAVALEATRFGTRFPYTGTEHLASMLLELLCSCHYLLFGLSRTRSGNYEWAWVVTR